MMAPPGVALPTASHTAPDAHDTEASANEPFGSVSLRHVMPPSVVPRIAPALKLVLVATAAQFDVEPQETPVRPESPDGTV